MKWTDKLFHTRAAAGFYDVMTRQVFWRNAIAQMVKCVTHAPKEARILDLGCGPGISTFALGETLMAPAHLTGMDLSREMVDIARLTHLKSWSHLTHVDFQVGDAMRLPYPDSCFDLVFGHSFLYLVDDPSTVLAEVLRVLKKNGEAVFMEPNCEGSLADALKVALPNFSSWKVAPVGAARFALSMAMWRLVSGGVGQMSPEKLKRLFAGAGFVEHHCRPTLGSLGLHASGRAPG